MRVMLVVGARPNFIKVAPLMEEFKRNPKIEPILVHTGQHYDFELSKSFFDDLEIPEPKINLEVGSHPYKEQISRIMQRFELVVLKEKPELIIVFGDVNSTLGCSVVASKLGIKIAHVEAGLRSFNWTMPEEINRVVTDRFSDILFTTEKSGNENLIRECTDKSNIYFVGNIMIDALVNNLEKIKKNKVLEEFGLKSKEYCVVTLHRPENVDNKEKLCKLLGMLEGIQSEINILFPMHPRTAKRIKEFKLTDRIQEMKNLKVKEPISYPRFVKAVMDSKFVMTDSGGIQEESTFLGVPCLTLREETERPSTVEIGTNSVIGTDKNKVMKEFEKIMKGTYKKGGVPELWDGRTSQRILKIIVESLE